MANYIVGVMGKKGSGKSHNVKYVINSLNRYIILDMLREYERGIIFYNYEDLRSYVGRNQEMDFKLIFRPDNDSDVERFLLLSKNVNNYTLILEEVDLHCNPYQINENLEYNIKYGRHYNRNLIWVTRAPFEVNRFLTRNSDLIVTFRQTEPRDLDYLKKYNFNVSNDDLANLPLYKYAYHIDNPQGEQILTLFDRSNMFNKGEPIDDEENPPDPNESGDDSEENGDEDAE